VKYEKLNKNVCFTSLFRTGYTGLKIVSLQHFIGLSLS